MNLYGPGSIGINEEGGLTRVDLVPDADGKYSCKVVWTNPVKSGSGTPKISLANGLVYVASYESLPDNNYEWCLTAVDFATGETVYRVPFGLGMEYTNLGQEIILDPDSGRVYIGVLGGLMVIEDTVP